MVEEWDVNKGGLRNTGITFCPATVLRAEGQIEFDRSLDLKIRRVHFLFSCEFRGPSGDFFIVGRVDKRNRHATTPWYLGFFDGQPPSRDFSRVNMCEYLCLLLDSAQVEYRDPSTFFKECFDEWPLCTRESIRKYIDSSSLGHPMSFHRFQGILAFFTPMFVDCIYICKKCDGFRVQRYVNNNFSADEYAPLWCRFKWRIDCLFLYSRLKDIRQKVQWNLSFWMLWTNRVLHS